MYGITQSTLDTGRVKIFYFAYSQWEGCERREPQRIRDPPETAFLFSTVLKQPEALPRCGQLTLYF